MSTEALRAIQTLLPDIAIVQSHTNVDDSYTGAYGEAPCIAPAQCVEGARLRAHRVVGNPVVRFAGFLDGIQRARIECHQKGIPVVHGTVAAAIRVRPDRRFVAWGHRRPVSEERLYMPLAFLGCEGHTMAGKFEIVDTSRDDRRTLISRHPGALRAVAFERVGQDRDAAERRLAELWCVDGAEPLFIDGGISGSARVASADCAIGVIKSHQKLYAEDDALDVVMSLRRGERSSVFSPPTRKRQAVISWYLRLHDPRGEDAMFGLVRIEACAGGDVAARANEISRWVLAELMPQSRPDARWDRMAYGIRDCEQFLRSIA
ncbi:MAG: hypothetical protein ABI194_07365 [Gemmatimonadaceae bacterium]